MDKKNVSAESAGAGANPYKHNPSSQPVGMVIGNLDPALREVLGLPEDMASIGIVTSNEKKTSLLFGADEAVK